jgi:hypothetical protein
MADFRGFAALRNKIAKRRLTESDPIHIWPLTDAALPDFPALFASVANSKWTAGPPV